MLTISFTVRPNIPERLKPLEEIAYNLWLSWHFEAVSLFMRLDYEAWLSSRQNPVRVLGLIPQEKLEQMAQDDSFCAAMDAVYAKFKKYLASDRWYKGPSQNAVAYFSMEYGLDEGLPIYSGGLGILSGDHLKAASDLGLPLVGVGLLYRQGYFQQYLNPDGFQLESYPENDWYNMPVRLCTDQKGLPVSVPVDMGAAAVRAQIWEVKVGRTCLYLLDTNIPENDPQSRDITTTLYGGDRDMRIRQEILLGVGGIRALKALGINPAVTHMNEGHSAFLGLERIRMLIQEKKLSFAEALQAVWPANIFTTHTPVPAGNERFSIELMEKYFQKFAKDLDLPWKDFLALGRQNPEDDRESFCMTILALKLSAYANGVSQLHGRVSRSMWQGLWPGLPQEEIPLRSITNGVHPRTWLSHDMVDLLDRYVGPQFSEQPANIGIWELIERVSDEELFRTHERRRERLVAFARFRLKQQLKRRGKTEAEIATAEDALSPYALTIAFARRFAAYKRANFLLKDPERFMRLLSNTEQPIQMIFAGKAHPHDLEGKEMIREIIHFASNPQVRSKIVFLEDYDMTIARYLVAGSDLWLNTPRRPLEASGTSGMKAAINGVLNVSILDGWWDEAYRPDCGWAIGRGEEYTDQRLQDEVEGKALYDLLEREIIPLFYTRGRDGLPREWIKRMKNSMRCIGGQFNDHRMLLEYCDLFYFPALANYQSLWSDDFARVKELSGYMSKLKSAWKQVRVESVSSPKEKIFQVGDKIEIGVRVRSGGLGAEEIRTELYFGNLSSQGSLEAAEGLEMTSQGFKDGLIDYTTQIQCRKTGRLGYTARVLPKHPFLVHLFIPGFIRWA